MSSPDYKRGYAAGRKRGATDVMERAKYVKQADKFNAAFLAVLPACVTAEGWRDGNKVMASVPDRVALAVYFANEAARRMK